MVVRKRIADRARVGAKVVKGLIWIDVEATLLGTPQRFQGKPGIVEILLDDGRNTSANFTDVKPLNDLARALLADKNDKTKETIKA